jgi:hypothetical protein
MDILTPEAAKAWASTPEQYLFCVDLLDCAGVASWHSRINLLEAVYISYCDANNIRYEE